mmetsp:Transcript_15553/g.20696  ORF Transcript_15553/g.20696 Transcript_15553/m.20696 type:complete len:94 (-) Transcript_15553:317-598(-)
MRSISKHAALKVGPGNSGKTEGSSETLLTLGVVVLEGDLNLNGLNEVTLLSSDFLLSHGDGLTCGVGKDVSDGLLKKSGVKFVRHGHLLISSE